MKRQQSWTEGKASYENPGELATAKTQCFLTVAINIDLATANSHKRIKRWINRTGDYQWTLCHSCLIYR